MGVSKKCSSQRGGSGEFEHGLSPFAPTSLLPSPLPEMMTSHQYQMALLTITNSAFDLYLPAIVSGLNSSFNKDKDILVLPLDLLKFDTHQKMAQDVLKHFGKVLVMMMMMMMIL